MPASDPVVRPTGVQPLVLVRHASTAWTKSGQHTGRTDLPLDPDGVAAAGALARVLAPFQGAPVYASPLRRALETCALTGLADGVEVDPDLEEWDYGQYEGWTTAEIQQVRPGWDLFSDGCPDGESASDVGARADRFLERIATTVGPVVVFGHGHALRVLAARWLKQSAEHGRLFVLSAPSVSHLGWERDSPTIQTWNH